VVSGQHPEIPIIVRRFEELEVYQGALALQSAIFELSKRFPKEETYSLTDQIRRSSRSVGANVAEAWHKRRYPSHFASKLSDSDAECAETRHWLQTAHDCDYITLGEFDRLVEEALEVGAKLGKMIQNAEHWKPR